MTATRRHLSFLIVTAVLGALMLVPSGAMAATSPATCDASAMIDAAANSRQLSSHTTACYRQALAALPPDLDSYAPIVRANLIKAMFRDAGIRSQLTGNKRALESGLPTLPSVSAGVRGPVTSLLEGLGPAHVDEVPVPVLALGGAAGLLLLAGLGTSLARTRQRRAAR
jgi:hypothetical protein